MNRREFLKLSGAALSYWALRGAFPDKALAKEVQPETLNYYFPETGHHVKGPMLDYYLRHRLGQFIGRPVTEEIYYREGGSTQFFENFALDRFGDRIIPINIGSVFVPKELYSPGQPALNSEFYSKYGGEDFFGKPLTPAISDGEELYQFTQNALIVKKTPENPPELVASYQHYLDNLVKAPRLLWPSEITVRPLGRDFARVCRADLSPRPIDGSAVAFTERQVVKTIQVDIASQHLTAFEDDLPIMDTAIASGRYGFDTEIGSFPIVKKYEQYHFVSPFPERVWYSLTDVPWNMLFYPTTGEFLHGAYWHSDFGKRHSSGCVNLNLDDAKWLYDWTEEGTVVNIQ